MSKSTITSIVMTTSLLSLITAGAFGAFGAIVHYLYFVVKETETYRVSRLLSFVVMGFFVGVVVNELTQEILGKTLPGLVLVSGFLFLKILEFFDKSGLDLILKRLNIKK